MSCYWDFFSTFWLKSHFIRDFFYLNPGVTYIEFSSKKLKEDFFFNWPKIIGSVQITVQIRQFLSEQGRWPNFYIQSIPSDCLLQFSKQWDLPSSKWTHFRNQSFTSDKMSSSLQPQNQANITITVHGWF